MGRPAILPPPDDERGGLHDKPKERLRRGLGIIDNVLLHLVKCLKREVCLNVLNCFIGTETKSLFVKANLEIIIFGGRVKTIAKEVVKAKREGGGW